MSSWPFGRNTEATVARMGRSTNNGRPMRHSAGGSVVEVVLRCLVIAKRLNGAALG